MNTSLLIYTDGACRGNPGPGGWGALLCYDTHKKCLSGGAKETTNNRMELTAAISALAALTRPCKVELYTDSQYLKKGITEWITQWRRANWKKSNHQPVKNVDLWKELDKMTNIHQINWHWVKGHSGHLENEWVDQLANNAIDHLLKNE